MTYIHPEVDYSLKWGKFHSKMIILKFENFIRIIIPTANLTRFDWYTLGQIVWFQDFYEKNENSPTSSSKEFENYLNLIFEKTLPKEYKYQNWFKDLNIDFSKYDYMNCIIDIVASFSGRFTEVKNVGLGRVKDLMKKYDFKKKKSKK